MKDQKVEAADYITPLAECVITNKGLNREVMKLLGLAELEFMDMGNELDAVDALRDTFIFLAEKMREDRTAPPTTKKAGKR